MCFIFTIPVHFILKSLCFIFTIPLHFIHSTMKVFKYYFVFIFIFFLFSILLCSPSEKRPLSSCSLPWGGINTENSLIRGSKLKGHKPPFWISVNLQVPDQAGKVYFCVTPREIKLDPNQLFSLWCIWSGLIWVSVKMLITWAWFLQNSSTRSSFKGSLMLPIRPYIWCYNHWKIGEKKFLNSVLRFYL